MKMKIKDALNLGEPLEAEILLNFVLRQPKEYLYTHPENNLTYRQEKNFLHRLDRRRNGEPIAYLTGHKEFYGLDFLVGKNTLIPRPESELLVEEVLKNKNAKNIIDVGTGCGCLAIALAKHLPDADITAIDTSLPALKIARQNAEKHHAKIKFYLGNLLEPIRKKIFNLQSFNLNLIVIANLPYLNKHQMSEPSIKFEPTTALYGGKDGLEYYKKLFKQIHKLEIGNCLPSGDPPQGEKLEILCEIDPSQAKKITKLAQEILPGCAVEIKKDLAGRDRVAIINCHGN